MKEHLGGHLGITHIDTGSLKWLKTNGVATLLDVGCSVGGQVDAAIKEGIEAWGIDGDYSIIENTNVKRLDRIVFVDLTKSYTILPSKFDAIWCVEVAEHIEEQYLHNLMLTFSFNLARNGKLIFTSNEGPGFHHVTTKPEQWWIELLGQSGFVLSSKLTNELKYYSTMEREFIRNTGKVFIWR